MSQHPLTRNKASGVREGRCTTHPDREGVGICVRCRSVVCVECSTRIDRLNYCRRCLQEAADTQSASAGPRGAGAALITPSLAVVSFLGSAAFFYLLALLVAALRGSNSGGVGGG